jgi:hypothetical protein
MTKKELIKNKWFMRNDISLREAWDKILDEYAEYVAKETFDYWSTSAFNDIHFKNWYEQFKAKENGSERN